MTERPAMIEAKSSTDQVRRVYDLWSRWYGPVSELFERRPKQRGLQRAAIGPRENVLEVAVGPGRVFRQLVRQAERNNIVCGVDLSRRMLAVTARLLSKQGYHNYSLQQADARRLPFREGAFDVLFNSYMLDLIPLADMPVVLAEFYRVLKPGGRLVLVNASKRDAERRTCWEWAYQHVPSRWAANLFGGCRPVLTSGAVTAAGFRNVTREYLSGMLPSEIVTARKPD